MKILLPVRVTQRELFVYAADLRCVARHELAPRGAGLSLDPAGLHPAPQRRAAIDLAAPWQTQIDLPVWRRPQARFALERLDAAPTRAACSRSDSPNS